MLTGEHDVLVVMVDARPAFAVPPINAGWLEFYDVETGETRTVSRAAAAEMFETDRRMAGRESCDMRGPAAWISCVWARAAGSSKKRSPPASPGRRLQKMRG